MECVSDFERSMPGALGQSQLDFGRAYPDVPVASTSQQHSSSNLNYNHHDRHYPNANAPISQNGNFQFSNSVQIASQNTLVSSNKNDGYDSDRSMTGASRSCYNTSKLMHMSYSHLFRVIIQKAYIEGFQKGQEAEANRVLQERSRFQEARKRGPQSTPYEAKQRDTASGYSSANNHEGRQFLNQCHGSHKLAIST
ncbi:hypothetical protein SCHPADRAFT_84625 [Schizopora paradoxa]|uniref:Uncharacterized protein n=1 Tax=Schizopora paradoxa TaxID=27342 RepID=A0A0H2S5L5_9AGAM|nr:hypothetical protein SCHPADRAFT_84625 [Schizopora paradoxa]